MLSGDCVCGVSRLPLSKTNIVLCLRRDSAVVDMSGSKGEQVIVNCGECCDGASTGERSQFRQRQASEEV